MKGKEEMIAQRIGKIASLISWLAQPVEADGFTGDADGKPTGFMDVQGHVRRLSVRVYPDGWDTDKDPDRFEMYFEELAKPQSIKYAQLKATLDMYVTKRAELTASEGVE